MSDENMVGPAREYEIIDKGTGLVEPVSRMGSGDVDNDMDADMITHKEDGTEVVFKREGQDESGNALFVNEGYVIRDRETKLAPNGVDVVEDIVVGEAPVAEEVAAEGAVDGAVTE